MKKKSETLKKKLIYTGDKVVVGLVSLVFDRQEIGFYIPHDAFWQNTVKTLKWIKHHIHCLFRSFKVA